jgi:hypothetical protein
MNCFDCIALGHAADAVAVCTDCGAGACPEHARVTPRWLTRTIPVGRTEQVEVPARIIRCALCQQARDAEAGWPLQPAQQRGKLSGR